ncbi:MAG: methylmalonyl-CoA mutase small subunit [Actinobacteria bacterium]|nr:methylmalonyl-CoA mutase small subunit [Thermoleophilia bacterium]MCB9012378.1 methylmalonyl-CoA mutase small subunit [Actinomycetota bacterium]
MAASDEGGAHSLLPLGAGFPAADESDWLPLVAKVVNRGRSEDRMVDGEAAVETLTTHTVDGLTIDPLYGPGDADHAIGRPGAMPFTRGLGLSDPHMPWEVRTLHDDPDPAITHEAILTDLARGAHSLWLTVGAGAIPVDTIAMVLDGVELDMASVAVTATDDQAAAAEALLAVIEPVASNAAGGSLGVDPIGHLARTGRPTPDALMVDLMSRCIERELPVEVLTVDSRVYHDAGGGDVEELACGIATGIEYLRGLDRGGISPTDAVDRLGFRVTAGADQFLTIARLRALRRLWARVTEECGVPENRRGARQHAVTSWRMMTRDDPWVNMLRCTIAGFGAVVGGAQALTVLPFDLLWGLPDEFSRRIARNTQILLAEESMIGWVSDPAGGAPYVESLTDQLATSAWALVREIEAAGGMRRALEDGIVADRLAEVGAARAQRVADRSHPITGVTMFPNIDEDPVRRRPRPAGPEPGPDALIRIRDAEPIEALRDRARAHEASSGAPPRAILACLGPRREFGAREAFANNLLAVAGIESVLVEAESADLGAEVSDAGASLAVLCSSPKTYAELAADAIATLRAAGVGTVYLAGSPSELADPDAVDGHIRMGIDIVETLHTILDRQGVAR